MIKKTGIFAIIILILISTVACQPNKKSGDSEKTMTETEQPTEQPTEQQKELAKVYITTEADPVRYEYIKATIKIFDGNGEYDEIFCENAGVEVRGHTTAHGAKKPYNIKFPDKENVLGMGKSKKWCLIANMFDPAMIRNSLVLDFARNIGLQYTSKCEYVEVYLNGKDMGMYLMCTPVSEGKDKVDLNLSENDYLLQLQPNYTYSDKPNITTNIGFIFSIEEGKTDDLSYLNKFINDFEYSIAYGIESVEQYADIESFVNYYVLSELVKDVDFATSSMYFYIKDNRIYAGPAWDFDLSMGNVEIKYYPLYNNSENDYEGFYCQQLWFMYLMQIPEFVEKVKIRFNELQPLIENLTTDNELGINRIDYTLYKYEPGIKNNYTIWEEGKRYGANGMKPYASYKENVEYLRQWIINRNEWLKEQWKVVQGA